MRRSKKKHHDKRPHSKPNHEHSSKHHNVHLGLIEVLFGLSGVLVIIGTILAMSENHKAKIVAVWVFVGAVIVGSIALGIRLTHEFSTPPTPPVVRQPDRPYVWIKGITSYLENEMLNRRMVVGVDIENAGNVAALEVKSQSNLILKTYRLTDVPKPSLLGKKPNATFIPPKGIMTQVIPDADSFPFDETLIPLILKEEAYLYVYGTIRYKGEAKNSPTYVCDWCSFYEVKQKMFVETRFHNDCGQEVHEKE